MTPFEIVAFGLATGSGMAYLWVAIHNWRILLRRVFGATERPESLVFLAGPVLAVLLAQGLFYAGAPLSGRGVALVVLLGLVMDPAALPAFASAIWRWARRRPGP